MHKLKCLAKVNLTSQITGGKKQSDEGAALFAVRVHLPCYAIDNFANKTLGQNDSEPHFPFANLEMHLRIRTKTQLPQKPSHFHLAR